MAASAVSRSGIACDSGNTDDADDGDTEDEHRDAGTGGVRRDAGRCDISGRPAERATPEAPSARRLERCRIRRDGATGRHPPVEDDQVGIVFMRWRIGEPLLPVAGAAVDRDDVIVKFCRGALAHPSVDEPPAEHPSPPIIGTSNNVTFVFGSIVVRYHSAHASTGKRDLYVKPIATSATRPDDACGSTASRPVKNCPFSAGN